MLKSISAKIAWHYGLTYIRRKFLSRMHSRFFLMLLLSSCFFFLSIDCWGQKERKLEDEFPTKKIDPRSGLTYKVQFYEGKDIDLMIKNKPKGTLYGNPCAIEATRSMGFQYAVQNSNMPGAMTEWERNWNNFKIKFRLFFTHSPFWKMVLKKRLRECGIKTGDRVG